MRYPLPALLLALLPGVTTAQNDAKVPDPDPELERKTFVVAPGFEVSLWAADPLLAKPIQMNWDPQGRLWVATSETYPQIKPGEKANDKIVVLEDTDGDGKADKTTVFADGLLIPTGVEPGDGGAYVANSTELVHLSASKPGGKADRRRVLLSGFGTEDTHHIIHTFRWGPDCALYFTQSIYIHSHIETPHGVKRLNAGGIWRFKPETAELDVFARGWVNSWGHAFDKWGQSFATDGAGGEGINHVVPGGYYMTSVGPHAGRILHGLNPGSPKHCGLEVVSGRHFPPDWQGDLITNDFRGHRVCRFKLSDDGSSYQSREMPEVIKSTHPAFRPIDVKMGPDGALYIADWYNPIIQHGEVDFRDPRRDKTHGRIWRVTAKGRPLVERPKLVGATVPELLEHLKAPEDWTRQQAKRVLKERGEKEVLPELLKWEGLGRAADDPGFEHRVVEVLRLYGAVVKPHPMLTTFREVGTPPAKAALVRMIADGADRLPDAADALSRAVEDTHPRVRLEAVRGLAGLRAPAAVEAALKALDRPMDRTLDYALWLTVRELAPYWMPEFKAGKLTFGGDPKKLAFALNAVGSAEAVGPVVKLIESGAVPPENRHGLYLLLARIGGPDELARTLNYTGDAQLNAAQAVELVRAVEDAVRTRKVPAPKNTDRVRFLTTGSGPGAGPAMRLAGLWKVEEARKNLEAVAADGKESADRRAAALEGLTLFGDAKAKGVVVGLCDTADPPGRRLAVVALAATDPSVAAAKAAELMASAEPNDGLLDVYAAFLARKGGAATLAKALADKKLPADVAKLGLRAVRSAAGADPGGLPEALTKAGGLGAAKAEATPEEVKARVADVLATGDPARGEAVFRRKELQCLACHAIGGAGGQVGPDLTSIGASAQPDYLVESLLLPDKQIKEGYHALRVVTADDKVVIGVKVREADGKLVLRTAEDKEVAVPTADIAEQGQTKSLMPAELTDPLTRGEFADLVRFLSELGKAGGYAPSTARVVRRWQVIEPTRENVHLAQRTRLAAAADPTTPFVWSPQYARATGELPLGELPRLVVWNDTAPLSVVRFHLDVTAAGKVRLKFNGADGLTLYAAGRPVETTALTVFEVERGLQPLTLVIDRTKRTDDVRVELEDVPDSPARAAVVGGK
ncbi:MAG: c-type cytochrome [Gemmataceae bacterium]|nr:c-type cytochrome [Gemmataceae bacterium]